MAELRAENDGERNLIKTNTEAWLITLVATSKLIGLYDYVARASYEGFATASTTHKERRQAHKLAVEALRAALAAVHEAIRELFMHTQMKHGTAGLDKLESLLGGITRSELTKLSRGEVATRVGDLLTALNTGFTLKLNADLVEAVRTTHAALVTARQEEAMTRAQRKQSHEALVLARAAFDRDSVRFARVVEGDPEATGLVIDLAAYRRDRKASGETEDTNDEGTDLSALGD
ncbi:hypothetical protein L6R49_26455 [Myxococcota bacterium]|nr:hypothetical protein [Myxococcota bacterium]